MTRARLLGICLSASAAALPAIADDKAAAPQPAADPTGATIIAMRSVGSGMFTWMAGQQDVPMSAMEPDEYDWSSCAAISHAEASALLVPDMVAGLPLNDGWGHPYEYCLWRPGHPRGLLMGIRSPGRDGKFEGTVYRLGRFDPADPDRDLVWMDGTFVTWPQAAD